MAHSETLDLVLKHKYYDQIYSGEKKEEYREMSSYWNNRIGRYCYNYVRFHRGYTDNTIKMRLKKVTTGIGKKEWGAPDYEVYILHLGEVVGL